MVALSKRSIALVAIAAICCSACFVMVSDFEEPDAVAYAQTIVYDANGGENAPIRQSTSSATGSAHDYPVSTQIPTRSGYDFVKWNTKSDGTGTDYYPGGTVTISGRTTVTLYAIWTLSTYTHSVVYYSNGGSGWMGNTVVSDHNTGYSSVTLATCSYTFPGYDFAGWNVNGAVYQPGQSVSVAANDSVTATAQWQAQSYAHVIAYDGNGGTGTMSSTVSSTVNPTQVMTLATNTFAKAGYSFSGWLVGGAVFQPGETVAVGANQTVTAVAQWVQNVLSIGSVEKQFGIAGGSVTFAAGCEASPAGASVSYDATNVQSGLNVSVSGNTVTCSASSVGTYTFTLNASATNYSGSSTVVTVELVPLLAFSNTPSAGALNA